MNASFNLSDFNWTAWSILMSDYVDPTPYLHATVGLGVLAAIENLVILLVLLSNKRLLKVSSLLIGLTVAHSLNGAMHAITFWPTTYSMPFVCVSALDCLLKVYPNMYIALYQLLPLILAMISIERCLAVATPGWYRANCTPRRLWMVTASILVLGLVIMAINCLVAWIDPGIPIYESCSVIDIFGPKYMIYAVHIPAILSGLFSTVCTLIGIRAGYGHIRKLPSSSRQDIERVHRQIRLAKCILMVSCIDLVFVVLPNVPLLLYNAKLIDMFSTIYLAYAAVGFASSSALNVVAYLLFNKEFRNACIKLIKCDMGTAVVSVSIGLVGDVRQRRSTHGSAHADEKV